MSLPWERSLADSISVCREESRVHLEMKRQVDSENEDLDTHTSDSKHTWRWNGTHNRRNAGEQLEMISAPSTWRTSSVPTSTPSWRMISASARAPER